MNIFEQNNYTDVRKPYLEASSLPPWCYKDQDFYNREIDKIFMQSWLFVARYEDIPNPGDFTVVNLLEESVVIIRTKNGNINAFLNICSHRGAKLIDGCGNQSTVCCPYHGWSYSLTGELIGAPSMKKSCSFNEKESGLKKINLDTWEGFIFINFSEKPIDLIKYLGDLPVKLKSYNLSDMICVKKREDLVQCNWKLYTEVDMEDYHAPFVHPSSIGQQVFPRQPSKGEYETTFFEHERSICVMSTDKDVTFPRIEGLSGQASKGTYFTMIYPGFF